MSEIGGKTEKGQVRQAANIPSATVAALIAMRGQFLRHIAVGASYFHVRVKRNWAEGVGKSGGHRGALGKGGQPGPTAGGTILGLFEEFGRRQVMQLRCVPPSRQYEGI